ADRSIHDAIMVVKDVVEKPYILTGGGAPEAFVAQRLREWANSLSGREQLAVERFAEALETIPLTLAENAGMDPIDTQVQLRSMQEKATKPVYGVNVLKGKVDDLSKSNICEPLAVKEQIISSAAEAAAMILRIDDIIAASKPKEEKGGKGAGGTGSMGGMGME
ncbi:MAG: TCP-1/cpn60 chaperonin family protein, partial [Candidatus Nitrosocaldus sp.]|nr:TCP-1/cpn60 chaperonin family protein [Candidatus Nitrosocaldus sp.]